MNSIKKIRKKKSHTLKIDYQPVWRLKRIISSMKNPRSPYKVDKLLINGRNSKGQKYIFKIIKLANHATEIRIQNCKIVNRYWEKFLKIIGKNKRLKVLTLNKENLHVEHVEQLLLALNTPLWKLDLRKNELPAEVTRCIKQKIGKIKGLFKERQDHSINRNRQTYSKILLDDEIIFPFQIKKMARKTSKSY